MKSRRYLFLPLLFAFSAVLSQNSTVSPYSRFGPGDLLFSGFSWQRAMGSTGIAASPYGKFNYLNPAAYAGDTLMDFEFGLFGERLTKSQAEIQSTGLNARLDYFSLAFPIVRNRMGIAIGFLPYSGTGYDVNTSAVLDSANSMTTTYSGSGGVNRYFISTGLRVLPSLTIGLNAGYLYGSSDQSRSVDFSSDVFFDTRLKETTTLSDFTFEAGVLWKLPVKTAANKFSLGATFGIPSKVDGVRNAVWENYKKNGFGIPVVKDTILLKEDERGNSVFPLQFGLGAQFSKGDQLILQADFRFQQWSSYSSFGESTGNLKDSWRIAAGAQYQIDSKSPTYLKRVQYRAGVFHGENFLMIRGQNLSETGVSFGFGLPMRKAFFSQISFGFEFGQRGTLENDLVRERYQRLVVGLSFNEFWFQKRRYD